MWLDPNSWLRPSHIRYTPDSHLLHTLTEILRYTKSGTSSQTFSSNLQGVQKSNLVYLVYLDVKLQTSFS